MSVKYEGIFVLSLAMHIELIELSKCHLSSGCMLIYTSIVFTSEKAFIFCLNIYFDLLKFIKICTKYLNNFYSLLKYKEIVILSEMNFFFIN